MEHAFILMIAKRESVAFGFLFEAIGVGKEKIVGAGKDRGDWQPAQGATTQPERERR